MTFAAHHGEAADPELWRRIEHLGATSQRTDLVQLPHAHLELYVKLECDNRFGSAKDRSAYWILREAVRRGEIRRDVTVVESSSGNFAMALAHFCRALGIRFIPVIDSNANRQTAAGLRQLCQRVEQITETDHTGGFLLNRLRRVSELLDDIPHSYWPDQYTNVDGARGHYELTGAELVGALRRVDYLFVGVGTGATVLGLSRRLKEAWPHLRVIAVDVEGSAIFGSKPHVRKIPGIGSSIQPSLVEDALIDDVATVSERDEVTGCRDLRREHAMYAGGSTGAVYAAINRYFEDHRGPPPVVAFLCVDGGEAYRDTIYDDHWVTRHLPPTGPASPQPPAPVRSPSP